MNLEEINQIKHDIEGKKPVSRKPVYSKTALGDVTNDIGSTYVEINMSKQHLWFYKDGALVTEGDVVTGNVGNGTATPEGTYSLKYKAKDSVLVGEGYRSPVSFWMPFIGNSIGLHDASWRSEFGGEIYKTSGSHGCVNLPYSLAQSIYKDEEVDIIHGMQSGDQTGNTYPDCSKEFFESCNQTLEIANSNKVHLKAPFVTVDKAGVVKYGLEHNVPYEKTWSCYRGGAKACGHCGTCIDRLAAFKANGVEDPIDYEDRTQVDRA